MFYKAENLEETLKAMNSKRDNSRDTRFNKLNPYKWANSDIEDEKTITICGEKGI